VVFVADILGNGTLVDNGGGSLCGLIAAGGALGIEARVSTSNAVVIESLVEALSDW